MPRAAGLAAEFKKLFSVEPELIEGAGGVFDVTVDGKLVYSKFQTGRHAQPGEVIGIVKQAAGS